MKYKRGNTIYCPMGCEYAIVFYNNFDGYFLVSTDKIKLIEPYTWTYDNTRGEPVAMIEGKKVRLSRFVSHTPSGLYCDHINGVVADNRDCNLRYSTNEQNNYNRKNILREL